MRSASAFKFNHQTKGLRHSAPGLATRLCAAAALVCLAACGGHIPHLDPNAKPKLASADYEGTYTCGGDTWKARLMVSASNDGKVLATANLKSTTVDFKSAIWGLKGTATDAGVLTLSASYDIDVPPGFKAHGFAGTTGAEGFTGTTSDASCGAISLPRRAEEAPVGG